MADILIVVRYHVSWPYNNDPWYQYNIPENTARTNYYGVSGVPNFRIDGYINGGANRNAWGSMIESEADNLSNLIMEISGDYDPDEGRGEFTVSVYAELEPGQSNLKLRVALTESNIRQNSPNGLSHHEQVFRDMIPSTSGEAFSISEGETLEFTYQFSVPRPLVQENCQLVAFVQSDQNREVLQSAGAWVMDLVPTGIEDDDGLPISFDLGQNYPNPFNAGTTIDFYTNGGIVALQVFDLTGSLVKTLAAGALETGHHSVTWDGTDQSGRDAASGVYFYRLSAPEGSTVKRMTLIR